MMARPNDGGGTTLMLFGGDSLDELPASHTDILTVDIRDAWRDPIAYFRKIADETRLPHFAKYLRTATAGGRWKLVLADTYMMERKTFGAFQWSHPSQQPLLIAPGATLSECREFSVLFSTIRQVQWEAVGCAGGLYPYSDHLTLNDYGCRSKTKRFPAESTRVFGNSDCGDIMIYNAEGAAGFLSHETDIAYETGSIVEMLDWVFRELTEDRTPRYDYDRP